MYCPNCSTKVSLDQKFCRACGLGLEKIAQSLGEQLPTRLDESLQEQKNKLERAGLIALSIFGFGIASFLLYTVGYRLLVTQGRIMAALGLIGLILFLGSGLLSVILFAKANEVKEDANKRQVKGPGEPQKPAQTNSLLPEGQLEPVPSVTERTTDLLFAEKNARAVDQEPETKK
jgi:hypothetical protein